MSATGWTLVHSKSAEQGRYYEWTAPSGRTWQIHPQFDEDPDVPASEMVWDVYLVDSRGEHQLMGYTDRLRDSKVEAERQERYL